MSTKGKGRDLKRGREEGQEADGQEAEVGPVSKKGLLAEVEDGEGGKAGAGSGGGSGVGLDLVQHPVPETHWHAKTIGMRSLEPKEVWPQLVSCSDLVLTEEKEAALVARAKAVMSKTFYDKGTMNSAPNVLVGMELGSVVFLQAFHQEGSLFLAHMFDPQADAATKKLYEAAGVYAAILKKPGSATEFTGNRLPTREEVAWTNYEAKNTMAQHVRSKLKLPNMVTTCFPCPSFPVPVEITEKMSEDRKKFAPTTVDKVTQSVVLAPLKFEKEERSDELDVLAAGGVAFLQHVLFRAVLMGAGEKFAHRFFGSRKIMAKGVKTPIGTEPQFGPDLIAGVVQKFMKVPIVVKEVEPPGLEDPSRDAVVSKAVEEYLNPLPVLPVTPNMEACAAAGVFREPEAMKAVMTISDMDHCPMSDKFVEVFRGFPPNPTDEDLQALVTAIRRVLEYRACRDFKLSMTSDAAKGTEWHDKRHSELTKKQERAKARVTEATGEESGWRHAVLFDVNAVHYFKITKPLVVKAGSVANYLKIWEEVNIAAMFGGQFKSFATARVFAKRNIPKLLPNVDTAEKWWNEVAKPFIQSKLDPKKPEDWVRLMPWKVKTVQRATKPGVEAVGTIKANRTGLIDKIPVGTLVEVYIQWHVWFTDDLNKGVKPGTFEITLVNLPNPTYQEYPGQGRVADVSRYTAEMCGADDDNLPAPSVPGSSEDEEGAFTATAVESEGAAACAGAGSGAGAEEAAPRVVPSPEDGDGHFGGFLA